MSGEKSSWEKSSLRAAYLGIVLFGFISLMGDIVYEGSRGILPTYLASLGASAAVVGLVFGLGDIFSFGFRALSGFVADRTRRYWLFVVLGYGLIAAIPLIGLARGLWIAVALILAERLGKALRTPSRNTLLSIVGSRVGSGKTFGLHELLDQVGAIAGPLIVSFVMLYTNSFSTSFLVLLAPYAGLAFFLAFTYRKLRDVVREVVPKRVEGAGVAKLSRSFWLYIASIFANTAGLVHVSLILFKSSMYFDWWIVPLMYLAIQAVDAAAAPISGYFYDKVGGKLLLLPFALSAVPSILVLTGGREALIASLAFFGVVLGMRESIYKATVTDITPLPKRGLAYGILDTAYGLGFMASGGVFGLFMSWGASALGVAFTVAVELVAIALLLASLKK